MLEIKRTDKRHTGHEYFKYLISVKRNTRSWSLLPKPHLLRSAMLQEYDELRRWCVETWGMSCDRNHYLDLKASEYQELNPHWVWHTEFNELKIYLATEKEATWAKLKWY